MGSDLAAQIAALHPRARILYMSGYTHDVLDRHGLAGQTALLLQKPFTHDTLVRHVRDALAVPVRT